MKNKKKTESNHIIGPGNSDLGGCQNYGPFLGTLDVRCRTIIGTQKGTIILTTTHLKFAKNSHSTTPCGLGV